MRKRIKKFLFGTWGGSLFPGTLNTGFDLASLIGFTSNPTGSTSNFAEMYPSINASANSGNIDALALRVNNSILQGLLDILKASELKNPFTGSNLDTTSRAGGTSTKNFLGQTFTFDDSKGSKFSLLFNGQNAASTATVGNMAIGALGTLTGIGDKAQNWDPVVKGVKNANLLFLDKANPLGGMANRASDFATQGIGKLLGKSTDYSDKTGQIADTLTDGLNYLGPAGMAANFLLDTANMLGSTKVEGAKASERVKTSSGYNGLNDKINSHGDKNFSGLGNLLGKDNKYRKEVAAINDMAERTDLLLTLADLRFKASNYGGTATRNQIELSGGIKPLRLEYGAKLREARRILNKPEKEVLAVVEVFKEGGKVNVIPDGALHKNRHKMEEIDDSFKELTNKGIPVVTESEGGELIQQAEIERNEIIFNLDITRKLEELMKDGSEEAALAAGKLLAVEIMENTIDNTGLMKEIA